MKRALDSSKLNFRRHIQQVYVGYVFGDSCTGQNAVYSLDKESHGGSLSGVPIINISNNGATGGTTVYVAHNAIQGGGAECVMALGFDKMYKGSFKTFFKDRESPVKAHLEVDLKIRGK